MDNRLVLVLGLLALGILEFFCIRRKGPEIENDLLRRSAAVLRENQIPTAGLSFSGRDALLTGVKGSPEVSDAARQLVDGVIGVRIVQAEFIPGTIQPVSAEDTVQAKLDEALKGRVVEFAGESAALMPTGKAVLDSIVPILAASPNVAVEIRGRPVSRPAAVKNYLVSKGIAPGRLRTIDAPGDRLIEFTAGGGK